MEGDEEEESAGLSGGRGGVRGGEGAGVSAFFSERAESGGNAFCALGCVLCFANPRVNSFRFRLCFGLGGASASADFERESLLKSNFKLSLESGGPVVEVVALALASAVGSCSGGIFGGNLRGGILILDSGEGVLTGRGEDLVSGSNSRAVLS